jgi:hypothetical protein
VQYTFGRGVEGSEGEGIELDILKAELLNVEKTSFSAEYR